MFSWVSWTSGIPWLSDIEIRLENQTLLPSAEGFFSFHFGGTVVLVWGGWGGFGSGTNLERTETKPKRERNETKSKPNRKK